jgi:hypothetical protein
MENDPVNARLAWSPLNVVHGSDMPGLFPALKVIQSKISSDKVMNTLLGYEQKFAHFIRLCSEAKATGTAQVVVPFPCVLGDTYEEVIESLSRLADAGLRLQIVTREKWSSRN